MGEEWERFNGDLCVFRWVGGCGWGWGWEGRGGGAPEPGAEVGDDEERHEGPEEARVDRPVGRVPPEPPRDDEALRVRGCVRACAWARECVRTHVFVGGSGVGGTREKGQRELEGGVCAGDGGDGRGEWAGAALESAWLRTSKGRI